jgi:hypothetical protein
MQCGRAVCKLCNLDIPSMLCGSSLSCTHSCQAVDPAQMWAAAVARSGVVKRRGCGSNVLCSDGGAMEIAWLSMGVVAAAGTYVYLFVWMSPDF